MPKKGKFMNGILVVVGVLCILYGICIFFYAGFSSKFHFIWIVMGAVLLVLAVLLKRIQQGSLVIPRKVLILTGGIATVGVLLFLVVEILLLASAFHKPDPGGEYMIILGCQVRGSSVSKALKYRLDAAMEYLQENPDTVVIVSGGQGAGEDISEAEAMRKYLVYRGISPERIRKEEQSTNTVENICYSKKLLPSSDARVIVVSNGFHIFRAIRICHRQGLKQVEGLAGSSDPRMAPAYYLREFFAVVKDFVMGNL